MKPIWLIVAVAMGLTASAAPAPSPWAEPAAALAGQIAEILGPGQARLTIHNLSAISNDEIPSIRQLLEQDLKADGVLASGAESANTVRLTLSENQRERLWVAEVIEGNETRVAMVSIHYDATAASPGQDRIVLRKERYVRNAALSRSPGIPSDEPVLAIVATNPGLVVLKQDKIVVLSMMAAGWMAQASFDLNSRAQLTRDPHGILLPTPDGNGFTAFAAGTECTGSYLPPENVTRPANGWSVNCHESDDPWPILQSETENGSISIKAFYNAARNYFTGTVSLGSLANFPPFYSAAVLVRPAEGAALLINGIDGKVQLEENGALKPVSGARDWGSDFALLRTACGAGTEIVASGSGEAVSDSLRAYELPALEVVPASAPLAMDGTVTALWPAPDGKSVFAVVRSITNQYEVDRVTASCN